MSDRNSIAGSSKINRWLSLALAVCLLVIGALGTAVWQLRSQSTLTGEDVLAKSDRLAALVEQEQQRQQYEAGPNSLFTDTFARMETMRQQMDALLSQQMQGFMGGNPNLLSLNDGIAVRDKGDAYEVLIPIGPGAELELQTDLEDNVLSVNGRIVQQTEQSQVAGASQWLGRQLSSRQFSRSITLPADVDESGLVTQQQGDQVVITVPKTAT